MSRTKKPAPPVGKMKSARTKVTAKSIRKDIEELFPAGYGRHELMRAANFFFSPPDEYTREESHQLGEFLINLSSRIFQARFAGEWPPRMPKLARDRAIAQTFLVRRELGYSAKNATHLTGLTWSVDSAVVAKAVSKHRKIAAERTNKDAKYLSVRHSRPRKEALQESLETLTPKEFEWWNYER